LLELSKCRIAAVETEQDRWLKCFIEGGRLDAERLPAWMQTEEMRQAMSTLKAFSEKERAYHAYQARQNYLRQQKSMANYLNTLHAEIERMQAEKAQIQAEKERARAAEEQARAEQEQVQAEKEAALAEIERLKALLRN
jgi:chromosome segregation ATPase